MVVMTTSISDGTVIPSVDDGQVQSEGGEHATQTFSHNNIQSSGMY